MAASAAKTGFGTTLSVTAAIGELVSISGLSPKRETIDVTHIASDATYREKISGIMDGGTVNFTINLVKAQYVTILGYMTAGTAQVCSLVLPSSLGTFAFSALVTQCAVSGMEVGGKLTAEITLDVTGAVTFS